MAKKFAELRKGMSSAARERVDERLSLFDGIDVEPEAPTQVEQEQAHIDDTVGVATSLMPIVEILPADFKLPVLIKFVPDVRYREAVVAAMQDVQGIEVKGKGAQALALLDTKLAVLRARIKETKEHFSEPTEIANDLHKRLTSKRADWTADAEDLIDRRNRDIYAEKTRLDDIAAEARRAAQAEADQMAREAAAKAAREAAEANVAKPIVQELKKLAKTATAPPVSSPTPAPVLAHSTAAPKWRTRYIGTPGDAEPHPDVASLSDAQRLQLLRLLKAIVDGKAPIACVKDLDWSYLDSRAAHEKGAWTVPGLEVFDDGKARAKPGKRR